MADPLVLGIIVLNLAMVGIGVLLLARKQPAMNEQAVGDRIAASLQPQLTALQSVPLIQPLKEVVDQRLPAMHDIAGKMQVAVMEANKALVGLQAATKTTPEIREKVGILEHQLKRLEGVERNLELLTHQFISVQGRGAKGEEVVKNLFRDLPTDLWDEQVALNGGKVDFVVHMPNKRILPIDSKTSGNQDVQEYLRLLDAVEQCSDPEERKALVAEHRKLQTKVRQAVVKKAAETSTYILPNQGTLGLAVQAVPDSLYQILDTRTLREAAERNVQVVPYGLLLPVINLMRSQNQYDSIDLQAVVAAMQSIRAQRDNIERALSNKFEKAAGFIQSGVADVRGAMDRIDQEVEAAQESRKADRALQRRAREAAHRV